jgi:hypothetical protein
MPDEATLDPRLIAELVPSVVAGLLEEWQKATGNQRSLEAWMTAGNTRAVVAVVLVTGAAPPRKVTPRRARRIGSSPVQYVYA